MSPAYNFTQQSSHPLVLTPVSPEHFPRTNNRQTTVAYIFTTEQGGDDVCRIEIGGRIYDTVVDENNEPTQISRYDEDNGTRITLCFNNDSTGSADNDILQTLKRLYLENWKNISH